MRFINVEMSRKIFHKKDFIFFVRIKSITLLLILFYNILYAILPVEIIAN